MRGNATRGERQEVALSLKRRMSMPLRLLCLLLISRFSSFSFWSGNENGCTTNDGLPMLVASWTTKVPLSGRSAIRYSTISSASTDRRQQENREFIITTTRNTESQLFAVSSFKGDTGTNTSSSATPTCTVIKSNNAQDNTTFTPNHTNNVQIHRLAQVQRVHCISDLHVDSVDNMRWLESKCQLQSDTNNDSWNESDLIVVAGDISHQMARIEESLQLLKQTGAHVVFVPGNHEAWLSTAQKEEYDDNNDNNGNNDDESNNNRYSSITKLEDIETLCRKLGVYTTGDCLCVGGGANATTTTTTTCSNINDEELWILPLDSWYDGSLSFVDLTSPSPPPHFDMIRDFGKWPWVDFVQCRWPSSHYKKATTPSLLKKIPAGMVDYFLERNQPVIDAFRNATRNSESTNNNNNNNNNNKKMSVMTVTHFLPNKQSLPDWKDLESNEFDFDSWLSHGAGGTSAKFSLVGGSDKIDAQIRSLSLGNNGDNNCDKNHSVVFANQIHVFGHSHRPKDFVYKGIRYIHNPLGKPREREMYMVNPDIDTKLVWEAGNDIVNSGANETIIRYWEDFGGGVDMLRQRLEKQRENKKLFFQKRKLRKQQRQRQQEQEQEQK